MGFNVVSFLGICALICTYCNFPTVKALLGTTVRLAERREFPFVVSVMHLNLVNPIPTHDHICTAALISRNHVLSAAHCIENRLKNQTIILADTNSLIHGRVFGILWWINYIDWSLRTRRNLEFAENDIFIAKMSRSLEAHYQPAILSNLHMHNAYNLQAVLVGWGISNNFILSVDLLTSPVRILSNYDCENLLTPILRRRPIIHERLFCSVGTPFAVLQHGDYGGPVLLNNHIIGINKETLPLSTSSIGPNNINFHTSIDFYRPFITHVIDDDFIWQ